MHFRTEIKASKILGPKGQSSRSRKNQNLLETSCEVGACSGLLDVLLRIKSYSFQCILFLSTLLRAYTKEGAAHPGEVSKCRIISAKSVSVPYALHRGPKK